jgi:hypothetical protein
MPTQVKAVRSGACLCEGFISSGAKSGVEGRGEEIRN